MKTRVFFASLCLVLWLGTPALAKEGVVARLRTPPPEGAQPGAAVTVAWSLVMPEEKDQPFNACGVFVQVRSAATAAWTRAYADGGACRGHTSGGYEASVVVPDGGIAELQIGLSGTTDIYFPVVDWVAPSAPRVPASRDDPPIALLIAVLSVVVLAVVGAASRLLSRPRPLRPAS